MRVWSLAAALGVAGVVTAGAAAQHAPAQPAVSQIELPGGLRAALDAIHDPLAPDRAHFLLDFIRRTHDSPIRRRNDPRAAALEALLDRIREFQQQATLSAADPLPLPLPPQIWTDAVFDRRVAARDLLPAILRSREASLFYTGLLSLDDETRAWIEGQPALVRRILERSSPAFEIGAPGLRVAAGVVSLPGGRPAAEGWEALIGRRMDAPAEFIPALLEARRGRLAYFAGAMAQLTPAQLRFALALDAPQGGARVGAMRRMADAFDRAALTWSFDQHAFWRPARDPSLLVADLRTDPDGRPMLPGTRAFWRAVFEDVREAETPGAPADDDPVDFDWLCEQIFHQSPASLRDRYFEVLFASHVIERVTAENARDALDAVRSMGSYPALAAELHRSGLREVGAFAAAARRASHLSAIRDRTRASRALAQFQGTVVLVTRGVRRGSLAREELPRLVTSLSSIDVSPKGDYQARLVRWIREQLGADSERGLVQLVSGPESPDGPMVEWEGTRYRVDFARAEATRIGRLLGEDRRPYFSSALQLASQGDSLPVRAGREFERLLLAADDQLARGLLELAYAVALGDPDRATIAAGEAAARHDFGIGSRLTNPWTIADVDSDADRGWHAAGALLGLDVALASRALTRVSTRPLSRAPTLDGPDRQVFTEAVALAEPLSLLDADRDAIAAAIRKGRGRVAAARAAADADRLAGEIRLAPARRTLLRWTAAHEPDRIPASFSPVELFWLGGGNARALQAWGASVGSRIGCLCLMLTEPRPWESMAGRWTAGLVASAFPDLNLRLAELLADLRMPASLLPSVLASATLDFVDSAASRDSDDRRALVEFVHALSRDQVEEYLALLTTGGPLVPAGDAR